MQVRLKPGRGSTMNEYTFKATSCSRKTNRGAAGPALVRPLPIDCPQALLDSLSAIESPVMAALNIIFGAQRRIDFEWPDGGACTVTLRSDRLIGPLENQDTGQVVCDQRQVGPVKEIYRRSVPPGAELVIEARLGPHSISISLASIAFLELLDGPNAALLPAEIKCALLESYLGDAVWQFEQAAGLLISITGIEHNPLNLPDRGYNLFFDIHRQGDRPSTSGRLSLDFEGLSCLAAILKNRVHPLPWDRIGHLPIPVGFVLGSTRLRLGQIHSLAVDDIVLIDGIATAKARGLAIRIYLAASPFWLGEKNDNHLVVESRLERVMEDNTKKAVDHNEDISDLEDIELELVFELGRKSLALNQIRRIGPGYIFDLNGELSQPVTIYINGGCIGKGDLVKIDNRLGVRLTQYLQRQECCDR